MKYKNVVIFALLSAAVPVALFLVLRPHPIVTRMPSSPTEKPRLLYKFGGEEKKPLNQPMDLAVGPDERVYVTDTGNAMIKVFSKNGHLLYGFGKKGTNPGEFGYPYGILLLRNGNLLIADSLNQNLQEFDIKGKYIRTWFDNKQKIKPGALAQDSKGNIYISDLANHQVLVMSQEGVFGKRITSKPEGLLYPQGIALDKTGFIWIADSGHLQVKQINAQGIIKSVLWGINDSISFSTVRGIAVDNLDRIFVTDPLSGKVAVFNDQRKTLFTLKGSFFYPSGIRISHDGKIFIINRGTGDIQVWGYKA